VLLGRKQLWLLSGLLVLSAWSCPTAQTIFTGEIGVDLESSRFDKSLKDTTRAFGIDRNLSNHFLDLRLSGPVATDKFASFSTGARLFGTYYSASQDTLSADTYIEPSIPTYFGSLSLFPMRPYPLRLYYNKSRNHTIRYEANNRGEAELFSPELAIIRRYQSDQKSRGAMWKMAFSEGVNLTTEYKHDDSKIRRIYDFDENKDIWVTFTPLNFDPIEPTHDITVKNFMVVDTLRDTVLLFIDLNLIDSVAPGEFLSVPVDSGFHEVEFVPLRLNPYRTRVEVRGDMAWTIYYNEPATPNDTEQKTNAVVGALELGNNGKFSGETYYEYSDAKEAVQRMTTLLNNFSNSMDYRPSRSVSFRTLTTFNQNDMTLDTITSQLAKTFMQTTEARLTRRRGLSSSISHSYNWLSTESTGDSISSTTHMITNQNTLPIERLNYTLEVRNSATLLSDSKNYVNNQYSTDITNTFDIRLWGVAWQPRNQTKLSKNRQENPTKEGGELENRLMLSGDITDFSVLGDVKFKGEYNYRNRELGDGATSSKKRYVFEFSSVKKFSGKYRISFLTNQEKETFGGSEPEPGDNPKQYDPARADQIKGIYRIDVQAEPIPNLNVGGNVMTIRQNSSSIMRYGASLSAKVPKLGIPIRSFIIAESRQLEGLPKQTQFVMETKVSYRFRQITVTLSHSVIRENLLTEEYTFQEIIGKISRHFSLL
jgi:hypothetical protein